MPPDETVTIRIELEDAIRAGLVKVERQADATGDAIERAGKRGKRSLRDQNAEIDKSEKGLRSLRLKALDWGFVLKTLKIPAYATAFNLAIPAVGALTASVMGLTSALGPSVGLLAGMPAAIGGILSVVGVIGLATKGVGDLVKVMTKQGATAKEVNKAMAGQPKVVIEFARSLAAMQKQLKPIQQAAAQELLPGFTRALRRMVPLIPMVTTVIRNLARTVTGLVDKLSSMLTSGPWTADFQTFMDRNNVLITTMGDAFLHVLNAMRNVVIVAGPFVQRFAELVRRGAQWLNFSTDLGRSSGRMAAFFDRTYTTLTRLGRTVSNFTVALFNLFRGGNQLGEDMWDSLEKISRTFRDWTESERGRRSIAKFFREARPPLEAMGRLVVGLAKALGKLNKAGMDPNGGLVATLDLITYKFLPAVTDLIAGIGSRLGPSLVILATAFAEFTDFASYAPLMAIVEGLAKIVGWFVEFSNSGSDVGKASHAAATGFVAMGLGLKSISMVLGAGALVARVTGLTKAINSVDPRKAGGISSLIRGLRGGGTLRGSKKIDKSMAARVGAGIRDVPSKAKAAAGAVARFGRAARDAAVFTGQLVTIQARMIAMQIRSAAATALSTARLVASRVVIMAVAVATRAWAAGQAILNAVLHANPIFLIVGAIAALVAGVIWAYKNVDWFRAGVDRTWQAIQVAWDWVLRFAGAVWQLAQKAWDLYLKFTPLGIAINWVAGHFGALVEVVKAVVSWIGRAISKVAEFGTKVAQSPLGRLARNPIGTVASWANPLGDTSRPRAGAGNLDRTMRQHAAISARTPGKQQITNVLYGRYAGSDHRAGRALDLVGSGLNTYARQVKAMGGFAEHHGSGRSRHLHAAFGDTARPRGGGGAGETTILQIDAPLIGQVIASQEIDVSRAVRRGISEWIREREERK